MIPHLAPGMRSIDLSINRNKQSIALDLKTEASAICYVRPPVKLSKTPAQVRHQARRLGQDTRAILADLGCSDRQVDALAQQGAILNGD